MSRRYVVLLRAITNVPMRPFRRALEELGFTDVESCGTSGNLLFNADWSDAPALERRIARRLGKVAFVRTRSALGRVVAGDPFRDRGGVVLFLGRAPTAARRRAFLGLEFEGPRPVLRGRTV